MINISKETNLYHIKWYPDYIEMNYYLHLIISQYNNVYTHDLWHAEYVFRVCYNKLIYRNILIHDFSVTK